jgi:hypothetical protein
MIPVIYRRSLLVYSRRSTVVHRCFSSSHCLRVRDTPDDKNMPTEVNAVNRSRMNYDPAGKAEFYSPLQTENAETTSDSSSQEYQKSKDKIVDDQLDRQGKTTNMYGQKVDESKKPGPERTTCNP